MKFHLDRNFYKFREHLGVTGGITQDAIDLAKVLEKAGIIDAEDLGMSMAQETKYCDIFQLLNLLCEHYGVDSISPEAWEYFEKTYIIGDGDCPECGGFMLEIPEGYRCPECGKIIED